MPDNVVDNITIEIESITDKADKGIDSTITSLNNMKKALNGINTKKFRQEMESFAEFQQKLKTQFQNIKISGNAEELKKQIAQAETQLDKLLGKESKMAAVSGINENSKQYRNLQYDIAKVCATLDQLYAAMNKINAQKPLNFWEKVGWAENLQKYGTTDESAIKSQIASSGKTSEPESLAKYTAENIKESFSGIAQVEKEAAQSVQSLGGKLQGLKGIAEQVKNAFSGLREKLSFGAGTEKFNGDMQQMIDGMRQAEYLIKQMESGAKAFDSVSYEKAVRELAAAKEQMQSYKNSLVETTEHTNRLKVALSGIGATIKGVFAKLGSVGSSIVSACKTALVSLKGIKSYIPKLGAAFSGLGKKIKSCFRLASIMLLRRALNALFSQIKEGFDLLALYSSTVGTPFNQNLSKLTSSLKTLGNTIVATFETFVNVGTPILNSFIQKLITATNAIGQLFAALTGKTTYTRAKKVVSDYVSGLDKATGSAKKLSSVISGIDELHILSKDNGSAATEGSQNPLEYFETVPIESKFSDFASKIKDLLSKLFEPLKKAWSRYGSGVLDALINALNSCRTLIKDMGKTWADVWLNGSGYKLCSNILLLLTSMFNWIDSIAVAWDNAWKIKGEDYVQSVFDKLNAIISLITTISESFRAAWDSGSGQEFIEHIYGILTNINNTIVNIATNFVKAWNEAGTGDAIAQTLFDIWNSILGTLESITASTAEWAENLDFGPLLTSIKSFLEEIKPIVDDIGDALEWTWKNVILPLGKWAVETALPEVINAVAASFGALDSVFELLKPAFQWIWDHMLEPLASWTGGIIVDSINEITNKLNKFKETIDMINDGASIKEIGENVIIGLVDGIFGHLDWLWTKLKEVFGGIINFAKDVFGVHSPSTIFKEIGEFLVDGFKEGLDKYTDCKSKVEDWAKNVNKWFKDKCSSSAFYDIAGNVVSGFRNGISNLYGTCKSSVESWASSVKGWFEQKLGIHSPSKVFKELAGYTVEGFNNGIENTGETTKSIMSDWIQSFSGLDVEMGLKLNVDDTALKECTNNYGDDFANISGKIVSSIGVNQGRNADDEKALPENETEQIELMREQNRLLKQILEKNPDIILNGTSLLTELQKEADIYYKSSDDFAFSGG